MKTKLLLTCLLLGAALAHADGGPAHWTYGGEDGPDNWSKLSPEFAACGGKNQSPVNVSGGIKADLKPIRFSYAAGGREVINNGHTVQVNYDAGSSIVVDGVRFDLKQFHFHSPSENLIDGKSYPMEAHLVHADADGNLAVVAVMFAEGHENSALSSVWPRMPHEAGAKEALSPSLVASAILPAKRAYYRFSGSLTTPPCSEGVRWLVMKAPVTASKEQIEAFEHVIHHPNNRPVQAVNARTVLR